MSDIDVFNEYNFEYGSLYSHIFVFYTVKKISSVIDKDTRKNKIIKWTIYTGIIDKKYNKDTFTNYFKKTNFSDVELINEFNNITEPIEKEYFINNAIFDRNLTAFFVVNSRYSGSSNKFGAITFVNSGKGIGKAHTNMFTQALSQARSKFNNEIKKSTQFKPMLADGNALDPNNMEQEIKDIIKKNPNGYFQYKYDGTRMITTYKNNKLTTKSRTGTPIIISETMEKELQLLGNSKYDGKHINFDGELYIHGESLSIINGYVNRETRDKSKDLLKYYIYDIFIFDNSTNIIDYQYNFRKQLLGMISEKNNNLKSIVFVPTFDIKSKVKSLDELFKKSIKLFNKSLKLGYEGLIYRLADKPYKPNSRKYMIKLKPAMRDEFLVVGFTDGSGKNKGLIIFICKHSKQSFDNAVIFMERKYHSFSALEYSPDMYDINSRDFTFHVSPRDTVDNRAELFYDMSQIESNGKTNFENNWFGKLYTVEFQDINIKSLLPMRGTGIGFRNNLD